MDDAGTRGETRFDRLLGGKLLIEQGRGGHRAGTDAILLSAAASLDSGERFVDVGAGVGTVGLALALRVPGTRGVLLEQDATAALLAGRNISANGLDARVTAIQVDLFDRGACQAAGLTGQADLVVTNPPFFDPAQVRSSPDPSRSAAHVLAPREGAKRGAGDWIQRCCALLGPRGRLVMVHRADALPDLLRAFTERLGDVAVRPVLPRADAAATRLLIGGRRGSRAPFRLLPPLVLHQPDGSFTIEADRLHRGEDVLDLWPTKNRPHEGAGFRSGQKSQ